MPVEHRFLLFIGGIVSLSTPEFNVLPGVKTAVDGGGPGMHNICKCK